ncbi:MAG: 2-hydroxychromene-2-carboxylate isomerase [Pseudomonadota bacterium]
MPMTVDFIYDFGSPNAYLSHCVIPLIESRADIKFVYQPALLGGIFKATNNVSPAVSLQGIRNKPEYSQLETQRWLQRYPVQNYERNPHFPVNTLMLMRGAVYAQQTDWYADYIEAMFTCMWGQPRKMDDPDVVSAALDEFNLPRDEILAAVQQPEVKQSLMDQTSAAVERGAFGSPTFFVGDEIYFGKEKLRDIEELAGTQA